MNENPKWSCIRSDVARRKEPKILGVRSSERWLPSLQMGEFLRFSKFGWNFCGWVPTEDRRVYPVYSSSKRALRHGFAMGPSKVQVPKSCIGLVVE